MTLSVSKAEELCFGQMSVVPLSPETFALCGALDLPSDFVDTESLSLLPASTSHRSWSTRKVSTCCVLFQVVGVWLCLGWMSSSLRSAGSDFVGCPLLCDLFFRCRTT